MRVARRYNRKKNLGKLFFKTTSTDSNYYIYKIQGDTLSEYTFVDNVTGQVLTTGMFNKDNRIQADLSVSSGDTSCYIKVDETSNGYYWFMSYYNVGKFSYIDFSVLPNLQKIILYNGGVGKDCEVVSSFNNLEYLLLYSGSYIGLDLSNAPNLLYCNISNAITDMEIDISNSNNLTYYKAPYSGLFNVSNHRFIVSIIADLGVNLDINVNNNYLPNLRHLDLFYSPNSYDLDLTTRDFSKLTYFRIKTNTIIGINNMINLLELNLYDYNTANFDFTGMNSLTKLIINKADALDILDLKPLIGLTSFSLLYIYPNLATILIDNGLNAQITLFENKYNSNTFNVKVDNPTDANNGVAPYLPTVWKEYQSYNSWNFI